MFFGVLKALLRMVANHSSVLCVDLSLNARATGRDTWSSTQAWKATSVPCVHSAVLAKTILSPTWRWDDMDFLHLVTLPPLSLSRTSCLISGYYGSWNLIVNIKVYACFSLTCNLSFMWHNETLLHVCSNVSLIHSTEMKQRMPSFLDVL